jgi:hypothetical protein
MLESSTFIVGWQAHAADNKGMVAPDQFASHGLCERCGYRGSHRTAAVCIAVLREEIALLQLALMGKPGAYARARRRVSEGRGIAARRETGCSYPQPAPGDAL